MNSFNSPRQIVRCFLVLFSLSVLACGSDADKAKDGSSEEASVVPGSTCEWAGDSSGVRLDVLFPGKLNAAEIIAITRWSNADASCAPQAPAWGTSIGDTAVASWEKGAVYVRGSEELLLEMGARMAVLMDCPEATFLGAEIRLDAARDGQGKLMTTCTSAY